MARIQIELPQTFPYKTRMQVRLSDLGGGRHLGNHMVVSYMNEALLSFLRDYDLREYIETHSLINPEYSVVVKSESMYGDILRIDMAIFENGQYGIDLIFKITNESSGKEAARAKMVMLFFDYEKHELKKIPDNFRVFLAG